MGSLPKNSPRDVSARRLVEGYVESSRNYTRHLGKLKARAPMNTHKTRLTHFPFFSLQILPSKVGIYLSMVPSNQTSFQESGPTKAVADNNSNSASPQKLATFRGSTVCETRPFDMGTYQSPYFSFPNTPLTHMHYYQTNRLFWGTS